MSRLAFIYIYVYIYYIHNGTSRWFLRSKELSSRRSQSQVLGTLTLVFSSTFE